jgi:chromosome partitioning protein
MTRIITVANQKGGVGKTTTVINLSASLAVAEKNVLVIDLDPQANATSGLGVRLNGNSPSVTEFLIEGRFDDAMVVPLDLPNLKLLPADSRLLAAQTELATARDRESRLKKALSGVPQYFDYILIDCPPSLSVLTLNALAACNSVLIPVQCEYYALEGLSQLMDTINLVRRRINPNLQIEGVLLTMYDTRLNLAKDVREEVQKYFGSKVYNTIIPRNVRLGEAPSLGKPLILYNAASRGAESYLALASEMLAIG